MNQAHPNPLAGTDGHSALRRRAGFGRWDIIRTQMIGVNLPTTHWHVLMETATPKLLSTTLTGC